MDRLSRQQMNIVYALRDGPKTSRELNDICFRYGARIWELNHKGYTITHKYLEPGLFEYTLISEPTLTGQVRMAI